MRLIDADALKNALDYIDYGKHQYDLTMEAIDSAPTIEEPIWHPYPQEKPTEHAEYLVTVYLPIWHTRIVCVDNYGWHKWTDNENDVVAWAELPKPYEEGAEE